MQYYLSGRLSQYLLLLACVAGIAGLLASRALIAIAPIVGVVAALTNPDFLRALPRYFRNGAAMRAAAIPAFLLLTGLYTSNWATWRHELYRDLVWLGVPLAFAVAVPLASWQRLVVGSTFVLGTAAVGLGTLGQYLLNTAAAAEAIRVGQNMPAITHIFHIAFGVMLALAFFAGLLLRSNPRAGRVLRAGLLVAAAVAALTLHVLAYRTGLLVFYAGLLALALRVLARRHLALGLALLAALALAPWLAYQVLPTVHERVNGTLWDVEQYTQGHDINEYSVARRLAALQTASNVVEGHWMLGVGPADVRDAMMAQYDWQSLGLRAENRVEVHNQYVQSLLGGGVPGVLLLLGLLGWPFTQRWARRDAAVCLFLVIEAAAMLVDSVLDLQIGLNFFVFLYGYLVVAGERKNKERPEHGPLPAPDRAQAQPVFS
ncbi:O-antigen ligase family protein [Hymenobacter properus]|uniref:O-antigen ligase family protein n=1 Tax=Hymenobacter properus TaxID=2791026 RepID=A0A931BC83_9BACT|nr:O-antigen ligase family protein [Hymenobacter properus]MBF9140629.1 O-antigen ligase family protein [Hymenobacter properus]MBR7719437.1 O-antigen ligase family protein [Microvirga sp. SRT04]